MVSSKPIVNTEGCKLKGKTRLVLPWKFRSQYLDGELTSTTIAWKDCLSTNAVVPIHWYRELDDDGHGFLHSTPRAYAKVISLWVADETKGAAFGALPNYSANMSEIFGSTPPVLVDFEIVVQPTTMTTERDLLIEDLDFAKTVEQENPELFGNAILIDTRPRAVFRAGHHPLALNIPYTMRLLDWSTPLSLFMKFDAFKIQDLPAQNDTNLIFVGESAEDPAPMRALLRARHFGWQHLFWYRKNTRPR